MRSLERLALHCLKPIVTGLYLMIFKGLLNFGLAWTGMDWHGLAWTGMDWHGLALSPARSITGSSELGSGFASADSSLRPNGLCFSACHGGNQQSRDITNSRLHDSATDSCMELSGKRAINSAPVCNLDSEIIRATSELDWWQVIIAGLLFDV